MNTIIIMRLSFCGVNISQICVLNLCLLDSALAYLLVFEHLQTAVSQMVTNLQKLQTLNPTKKHNGWHVQYVPVSEQHTHTLYTDKLKVMTPNDKCGCNSNTIAPHKSHRMVQHVITHVLPNLAPLM